MAVNDWAQIVVTAVIGLLTVGGSYGAVAVSRRNAKTTETDVVTDAALSLIQPLKDRVSELESKVDHLESELKKSETERNRLHRWALTLYGQLEGAGIDPIRFEEIKRLDGI